ncbi:MAG: AraC family transcriptional regulator [Proteobacteria bacterium]|nr:AraC family transcriptional regulator [Pseudomonadota bacterium]
MKPNTSLDYSRRIQRVIRYMGEHLDADLDLASLAEVAHLSPYHFHRIYAGMTGETAAESLRRLRLHRAAGSLIGSETPVRLIARAAGYGSVAAFTRAFQSAYGTPPATYRQRGFLVMDYSEAPPASRNVTPEHAMFNVTIRECQPVRLAAFRHQGHYLEIGSVFERLFAWAGPRGLMGPATRGIGIYYSDTASAPPAEWRSDACISVAPGVTPPDDADGPRLIDLAGGRHAVLRHKGPYAELHHAYAWLFGQWLPGSGEVPADRPVFEEYLNNPRELPPEEWLTEINLPLVAR